eukprot:CAMPEP_0173207752 /NCGR_PEP_ID=MMETSP1141-20130122/22110_1 /TAXON_ID=483371 /ORGANISM="non described non described, Strain CCMP2298" /LENGTH=298 /DNA_ID=CAMNT_0014134077 /DNA_START=76 /DNA_END=972 /DNA_ORIENTATION=-
MMMPRSRLMIVTRFSLLLLVGVLVALVLTVEAKKGSSKITVNKAMVNFQKAQYVLSGSGVLSGPTSFDVVDVDARAQQMERVKSKMALMQQKKELNRIKIVNRKEAKKQSKLAESDIGVDGPGGIEVKAVTERVAIVEDTQAVAPSSVKRVDELAEEAAKGIEESLDDAHMIHYPSKTNTGSKMPRFRSFSSPTGTPSPPASLGASPEQPSTPCAAWLQPSPHPQSRLSASAPPPAARPPGLVPWRAPAAAPARRRPPPMPPRAGASGATGICHGKKQKPPLSVYDMPASSLLTHTTW